MRWGFDSEGSCEYVLREYGASPGGSVMDLRKTFHPRIVEHLIA